MKNQYLYLNVGMEIKIKMFKLQIKKIRLFITNKINKNFISSVYVSLDAINGKNIEIGENTFIDSTSEINSYAYIGKNVNITKSTIRRFTSIANNVSIGQGEHNLNKISTSAYFYENSFNELTKEDCIIGNDVWIGTDAIILRGVNIEDGAVIGANSVVTKDVSAFSIVAGVPAKHIRYRFDIEKIEKIEKSQWWNKNFDTAKQLIKVLEND